MGPSCFRTSRNGCTRAPGLEAELGHSDYTTLISFDFGAAHARHELERIVLDIYERHRPGRLARDRATRLASGLIDGTVDFLVGIRGLARLASDDHDWVPVIFIGIDSDLDDIPRPAQYPLWDEKALAEKLAEARPRIEHMRQQAKEAARELLRCIE